jgi:hypothetical protein
LIQFHHGNLVGRLKALGDIIANFSRKD